MPTNPAADLGKARLAWIGLRTDALSIAVHEACRREGDLVKSIYSEKAVAASSAAAGRNQVRPADECAERWTGDTGGLNALLAAHAVDLVVVAGCHHLLKPETIQLVGRGCYNVHPSVLPAYRGSNPIFWQYQRADLTAGVTVHAIDCGMDTGPICAQEAFTIPLGEPLEKIVPIYAALAARLVAATLRDLRRGELVPTAQEPDGCPFIARKTRPSDYLIDWAQWPLRRCWHFLRLGAFVPAAALPEPPAHDLPVGEFLAPQCEPGEPAARGPGGFAWEVGALEPGPAPGSPGSIRRDACGWVIQHPDGGIRLARVARVR